VRFNGQLTSVPVPIHREPSATPEPTDDGTSTPELSDSDEPMIAEDDDFIEGIEEGLRKQMEDTDDEIDEEDAPDWVFEEGETKSRDPGYTFCPAPHRKQLLRLITTHFCRHSLLPESNQLLTQEQIRAKSVYEMYLFCYQRGLHEVWGYMWTSWYSAKMWPLWALSASDLMSRIRTTMAVENVWKQLKHDDLHHLLRPRVDQLVWIIITKVTSKYMQRADALDDNYRLGRSKALTTFQKYFKREWLKLHTRAISKNAYVTNVFLWICSCGQQKYHQHLLCKHLVAAVPDPPSTFWGEIYRRRVVPFYRHPAICPENTARRRVPRYIDPDDGSITEGDDHLTSGNPKLLQGGGDWKGIVEGKRAYTAELKRLHSEIDDDIVAEDGGTETSGRMDVGALEDENELGVEREVSKLEECFLRSVSLLTKLWGESGVRSSGQTQRRRGALRTDGQEDPTPT
jgi:hypothetical protein